MKEIYIYIYMYMYSDDMCMSSRYFWRLSRVLKLTMCGEQYAVVVEDQ